MVALTIEGTLTHVKSMSYGDSGQGLTGAGPPLFGKLIANVNLGMPD